MLDRKKQIKIEKNKSSQGYLYAWRKSKAFFIDHWQLLIKSAAENHLRIQQIKQDPQEGESCNLTFTSYFELKRYQKKVRLFTYSTSSTLVSVLVAIFITQVIFPGSFTQGATFHFQQTAWTAQTANTANHNSNQTGWGEYQSKDAGITTVNGGADVQLELPATNSVQEDNDAQFDGAQAGDGFYMDGSGRLLLKKPTTATCGSNAECASGNCTGNVCI